jgi:Ca2+-binding EF-hand superfamily protein
MLTEARANTMPNGKGPFWNKPEFKVSNAAVEDEYGLTASSFQESVSMGYAGSTKLRRVPKVMQAPHPLDKEEEHLAVLLENLFPSSPIAKGGSRRGSAKADTNSFASAQGDGKRDEKAQSAVLSSSAATPEPERSPLKTSRSDFGRASVLHDNAVKLINVGKGAVHRDLGGGAMTVQESSPKIRKESSRVLKKSDSAKFIHQAMGDPSTKPPASPEKKPHPAPSETRSAVGDSPAKDNRSPSKRKASADSKNKHSKVENSTFDIRAFRKRLLNRFATVVEAFNSVDVDADKKLSLKEWTIVLKEYGLATYREARSMYELMDADKNGSLTFLEFYVGMETLAPVYTVECLRKRLLCLSFPSMTQALIVMDGGSMEDTMAQSNTINKPLSFQEFSVALQRVNVYEPAEHRAIFDALRMDSEPAKPDARVSLADLAAALAAVSPALLLEDLRARLTKTFGSVRDAWRTIAGPEWDGPMHLNFETWQRLATERLHMSQSEAAKTFNLIDVDDSGEISRPEFIGAMSVSCPSLLLEDARHKVRQGFISINRLIAEAIECLQAQTIIEHDAAGLDMDEFASILAEIDIGRKDADRLFKLMDVGQNGTLSLLEFFKGVRLFAPACRLEGLRLQMLQTASERGCTLAELIRWHLDRPNLDRKSFRNLLERIKLLNEESADLIFDFLDIQDTGIVTVSEVIAVMQNMQPGTKKVVEAGTRDEKAERLVQMELRPFHQVVVELKKRVKQGLREGTAERRHRGDKDRTDDDWHGKGGQPRLKREKRSGFAMVAAAHATHQHAEEENNAVKLPQVTANLRMLSPSGPPRAGSSQGPHSTYLKLHSRFKRLPPEVVAENFGTTIHMLNGYFNSAHCTLQDQRECLSKNYSRRELHKSTEELKKVTETRPGGNAKTGEAVRF